jgi:predicted negative regulator of RcsB-dependent stress response
MMSIREKYQLLATENYNLELLNKIKVLRDQCIFEQNKEYYYLCNLLIIDICIELNNSDDAISIITKDISDIDSATFKNIYVSYLERIIYIYIRKSNFKVAYRYVFEKRKYIDDKNRNEVNRWYLEMAYVYAEMNQKSKALANLKAILENLPDEELLSHTLSNLTKLYIDEGMITEAKETLNECLKVTSDDEGITYCNYLYAQISVLEKKYDDALLLYEEIFNREFDLDYLSMGNDYLDLLIKLNLYDQAQTFINKVNRFIDQTEDLNIKKTFNKHKLNLIISRNNLHEADELLKQLNNLDESILAKDSLSLNENIEDDKNNEIYIKLNELTSKIERLMNLMSMAFTNNNLRDILMDFSKKLESIIEFEEVTYAIYDNVVQNQEHNEILTYNYKKQRLYEKTLTYDDLKNTVIEAMLINGKEMAIDFTNTNLPLIDPLSRRSYTDMNVKYLFAIPCSDNEGLFLTLVFKSKVLDLTTIDNSTILKISAKFLGQRILNSFISERLKVSDFINETITLNNKLHTVFHYRDKIVFNEEFSKLLNLENNEITKDSYLELLIKGDVNKYRTLDLSKPGQYDLKYHLKIQNTYTKVRELINSYKNEDLFYVGTIEIIEEVKTNFEDEPFYEKINELKSRINDLEFNFSLIRIKANRNEFESIQNVFDSQPYYLSDETMVVILENEVNQRVLDKYIKGYDDRVSIVRYPRDLVNIDDVIKFSKISLDNNILYFTDDMYQKYLKRVSINNLVSKMLTEPLELWYLKLNSFNQKPSYEVKCRVKGLTNKENIREFLDEDLRVQYETMLYDHLTFNNLKVLYYVMLSGQTISDLILKNKLKNSNNQILCLDSYHKDLIVNIKKLKELGIKVFLNYRLLEELSVFDLITCQLDGLVINEGMQKEKRQEVLYLAKNFNFSLFTNYEFTDYPNCVYKTEDFEMEV